MDKLGPSFTVPVQNLNQPAHQPAPPQPATGASGGPTSGHPARRSSADHGRALLHRNSSEHGKFRTALAKRFRSLIDADPELKQTFAYYKGTRIIEAVENAGTAIDLPPALVASRPDLKQGAHYAIKRKEIQGREFAILYEISMGQVVNATVADRALLEAVDAYHQNAENREETAAVTSSQAAPETTAQPAEESMPAAVAPESSTSTAMGYGQRSRMKLSAPQPSTSASGFTAFAPFPESASSSGDLMSFPDPESSAGKESDKAADDAVLGESGMARSEKSGSASRRSPSNQSPGLQAPSRPNTPGGIRAGFAKAVSQRVLIAKREIQGASGRYTDSTGMLTSNLAFRNSPLVHTPAESIRSLSSIEDVVPGEEKLISGVAFAQRMESLLQVHLPEKTGAVKQTKERQTGSAYEPSWQERLKVIYDLTQEHCFMAAWLDALGDELAARGIDVQRDRIDTKLQAAGGDLKDLDQMLYLAGAMP